MQKNLNRVVAVNCLLMVMVAAAIATPPIPTNYLIPDWIYKKQSEEQIFVCPTDSLYVLCNWRDLSTDRLSISLALSTDGGNTWDSRNLYAREYFFGLQSDPTMAVDNDGNFYVCFMDLDGVFDNNKSCLNFIKSIDKGETWDGPYMVDDTLLIASEDKQFITIDRTNGLHEGNVYVSWSRFPNPIKIMFARSTDGAENWDEPIIVGPPVDLSPCGGQPEWDGGHFSFPLVGSDGSVYVFWSGVDGAEESPCQFGFYDWFGIKMVKSTDGGVTFTEPKRIIPTNYWGEVDGSVNAYANPVCAADITGGPFNGNIYLTYTTTDHSNQLYMDWNIYFMRSSDGGESWSYPYCVNDDYTGPGAMYDQFHPWLICNQEGTLVMIFYDQRTDPVEHFKFDVFAAYSFDGGESFTTNHRVSEVSIDPTILWTGNYKSDVPNLGSHFKPMPLPNRVKLKAGAIAEYIGVTAFKDHVNAAWTDTRNYTQDVFGANWVIPLLEPRLQVPGDGGYTIDYPYFDWATSWKIDDDQYLVEVATDDQFTDVVLSQTVTESELVSPVQLAEGTYYWRAKTMKISEAEESEYSPVRQFTVTLYIPPVVELLSPVESEVVYSETETNPTFEWNLPDVPSVPVYYNLELSTDPTFTDDEVTLRYSGIETTTYTIPDPIDGIIMYYWRVEAENPIDQSNGFCDAGQFELVICKCGDVNNDGAYDLLDIVLLIDNKFKGGEDPVAEIVADVNHDGVYDLLDIVYMIDNKFKNGPDPDCQ